MHSVAAVGRQFIFNLDMQMLPTLTLNPVNNQSVFRYLQDVSTNRN